jgi:hypothetical protein
LRSFLGVKWVAIVVAGAVAVFAKAEDDVAHLGSGRYDGTVDAFRLARASFEPAHPFLASKQKAEQPRTLPKRPCGAKTLFTPRDHPDLQAEPGADAPHG